MTTENQQPVVTDTNAQAKPDAAGADARSQGPDEFEALWKEYDTATAQPTVESQPKQTAPATADAAKDQSVQKDIDRKVEDAVHLELRKNQIGEEIKSLVDKLRGDSGVSHRAAKGWLEEVAKENPALGEAYFNPKTPKDRERVVRYLERAFNEEFPAARIDAEATENHEVVAAAVRGSSTKAPEGKAPDYSKMSNQEFANQAEKDFGFRPI